MMVFNFEVFNSIFIDSGLEDKSRILGWARGEEFFMS